ncbi:nitroreductase family deazaflavin-dependent oxidoreductase [Nonomuraea sp. NN258]|uniref:nitroreductase/quinone reductase family protein n=1 Tax=Nonomuraea antri TaxID=2730852 RepID=UPI001567DB49|nr:nitroreductase/quinone reductase family protein [Nonomuraea antri]NRQ31647.1 nitroreductase family deazaflavin-dependent oxidoreductase [Nonomuraea antri]
MGRRRKPAVIITSTPWFMRMWMRLFNPMVRNEIRKGAYTKSMENLILLHFHGRKSGKLYEIPVMKQDINGRLGVFTDAGWRANFRGGMEIEVFDRGVRSTMTARLENDPEALADIAQKMIRENGLESMGQLGMVLTVPREPTREELVEAAARHNLGIVFLTRAD